MTNYVVAKLADEQCVLAACPRGWGILRLTRQQEVSGEFIPDLVGSTFHLSDGLMATSFIASAQGDEVEPFSQLVVTSMLADNPIVNHTVCVGYVLGTFGCLQYLWQPMFYTQAVYLAPQHNLGDVFDVATADVVMWGDSNGTIQSYGA